MVVIAIVGILAAVALPAYSSYTNKSKVAELIMGSVSCKMAITQGIAMLDARPAAANAWGCDDTAINPGTGKGVTKYLLHVSTTNNGKITVQSDSQVLLSSATDVVNSYITFTPMSNTATGGAPDTAREMDLAPGKDLGRQVSSWKCEIGSGLKGMGPSNCTDE